MADREFKIQKVGSDSELFLMNSEGKPVPVCGLVGGTKEEPIPVLDKPGFAVQEDNVMLEFNIPPASTAKEFGEDIARMLKHLEGQMEKKNLRLYPESLTSFSETSLIEFPSAMTFGCLPDLCVWTRSINESASHERMSAMGPDGIVSHRVAGAHIHVSFTCGGEASRLIEKELMVKALDAFIGVPMTIISTPMDGERRAWYGRAGAFRIKDYGIEYRVLGGSVLKAGQATHEYLFEQVKKAEEFLNNHSYSQLCQFFDENSAIIQKSINHGRSYLAHEFCLRNAIPTPPQLDPQRLKEAMKREEYLKRFLGEVVWPVPSATTTTTAQQAG